MTRSSSSADARLLGAAANAYRLTILRRLSCGASIAACDFGACCPVAQPTLSHHLKVLRESGWLIAERRGTHVWYSLDPSAVARFRTIVASLASATEAVPFGSLVAGPPTSRGTVNDSTSDGDHPDVRETVLRPSSSGVRRRRVTAPGGANLPLTRGSK